MLLSEIAPEALPSVTLPAAFSGQEVDQIERIGDGLATDKATVAGAAAHTDTIRIAETAWLLPGPETQWLYAKLGEIVRAINEQLFQFTLTGFSDPLQYTIYRADQGGHY